MTEAPSSSQRSTLNQRTPGCKSLILFLKRLTFKTSDRPSQTGMKFGFQNTYIYNCRCNFTSDWVSTKGVEMKRGGNTLSDLCKVMFMNLKGQSHEDVNENNAKTTKKNDYLKEKFLD